MTPALRPGTSPIITDQPKTSSVSFERNSPRGGAVNAFRKFKHSRNGCRVAPAIGMAQGAIDSLEDLMRVRVEGISGGRAGERQSNHLRLAESSAEIDAVRLTLRHNIKLLIDSANSGDDLSTGERLRIRRDITFAGKLCHRATQRLFETGGAHAILRSAPLQRFTRDVDAAFHSGVLNWDPNGEAYGRFRLGLAPNTFFF
jgi:3-hydroxy-9,10-secoandrosta-1,3,5(10)-triene-9,17-dione monooxygenase